MKLIFTLITTLLSLSLIAQNGGQSNENPACKLEWVGFTNNQYVVKLTNKQTCDDTMMVIYASRFIPKFIPAGASDTIHLLQPQNGNICKVFAKAGLGCRVVDYGTVELNVCQTVPLKLTYFQVKKLNNHQAEVTFEVSEVSGVNHVNFQISNNGKDFKTIDFIISDNITPNTRITKKINY